MKAQIHLIVQRPDHRRSTGKIDGAAVTPAMLEAAEDLLHTLTTGERCVPKGIYEACAVAFETTREDAKNRLFGAIYGKRKKPAAVRNRRPPCPACSGELISAPIETPLRCTSCRWKLFSQEEWGKMSPFQQGYTLYAQSAWPTSPLHGEKNPYAEGSAKGKEFQRGEQQAALNAQDSEE